MFAERDKDHDGHLSFEEFAGQETKMERSFKSMDRDGDGYITKSEFKHVCKSLTKGIIIIITCKKSKPLTISCFFNAKDMINNCFLLFNAEYSIETLLYSFDC